MSVTITRPISGIIIEGREIDIRPKEPLAGTYEAPTVLNLQITVDSPPENYNQKALDLQGKPLSGRVWMDKESRTSTKSVHHKPNEKEATYRKARIMQIRDFNHQRKKEIADKVEVRDRRSSERRSSASRRRSEKRRTTRRATPTKW